MGESKNQLVARATALPGSPQATGGDPFPPFLVPELHLGTHLLPAKLHFALTSPPFPLQKRCHSELVEGSVPPVFSSPISTFSFSACPSGSRRPTYTL